ncbi:MAG: Crp/Fnr family transcriptional regulator [Chitinophagales bacterium]
MDSYDFLRQFHPIDKANFELLLKRLKSKTFNKGDFIIVPGQIQRELYFIKNGVQMSYSENDGKEQVVAFTYPPNLCAIPESFSFQTPSKYFLSCLTDSEVDYITYGELQTLFDESQQLERLFRRMTEALLAGMINRHTELHSLTIEERFRNFCKRSPHLLQLVPHKFIASYLGISPTNFSKLYNKVKI